MELTVQLNRQKIDHPSYQKCDFSPISRSYMESISRCMNKHRIDPN